MREDRDYGEYSKETTIIEGFECYEEVLKTDFGTHPDDFMYWFLLYRRGFIDGGNY